VASDYHDAFMLQPLGATIVPRRTAPGYRLVIRSRSRTGMPIVDTMPIAFASIKEAMDHANREYGIEDCRIEPIGQHRLRVEMPSV
jgi:hypothetical protein